MLSYIYIALRQPHFGAVDIVTGTGKKYELTKFFQNILEEGESIAPYTVVRMKPNQPATVTYLDVYDFMQIDPGEEI